MPTAPATPLFDEDDLTTLLGRPISDDQAEMAERVVWGWVKPLCGLTDRPGDAVTPELDSAVLELGAIFVVNPENLLSYELADEQSQYSSERRAEILRAVASGGAVAPGAVATPLGSFPPAARYPDPAERRGDRWRGYW